MTTVSTEDFLEAVDRVLVNFEGVERLNLHQRDSLLNFIERRDVFAILPTGFGKSLIFQLVPSICISCKLFSNHRVRKYQYLKFLRICRVLSLFLSSHWKDYKIHHSRRCPHHRIDSFYRFETLKRFSLELSLSPWMSNECILENKVFIFICLSFGNTSPLK